MVFNLTPFVSKRLPQVFSSAYFSNKLCFDWGDFLFSPTSLFLFNWKPRCWQHFVSEVQAVLSSHSRTIYLQKFDFTSTFWIANCPYWWDVFGALIDLNPQNASPKFRLKLTNCLFAWFSMKSYRFQLTKHWFVQQKLFLSSKWNRNWTKFNNPRLRLKGGQISQVILLDV